MRLVKDGVFPADEFPDPILSNYRFCNVNREHDTVTRWIAKHVRPVLSYENLSTAVSHLYVCRIFNEPAILNKIMPLTHFPSARKRLHAMKTEGHKLLRGAYMCVSHGAENRGKSTIDYFMDHAEQLARLPFSDCNTLHQVAKKMKHVKGIGDFIANQVCTDLRYQSPWAKEWLDWTTFVLAGPGTKRGLNRYYGHEDDRTQLFPGYRGDCQEALRQIRYDLRQEFSAKINDYFTDINNLSNCFCEFDKYERARHQYLNNKRITLRKYHGIQST